MLKKLRRRFVFFNMLIISLILTILSIGIMIGSKSNISGDKWFNTIVLSLVLVFLASWSISKFALNPIKQSWQKQLDFTSDASHELRTPLTVIQTSLEIVLDNPTETVESQRKWLENIYSENIRMTKLVADLLTLSRDDTNELMLELNTFLLDEAIRKAVVPFEPIAISKDITFKLCLEPQLEFYGDKQRMVQLVIILVDNALKYMNRAGQIYIILNRKDKGIELEINDSGVGIEAEYLGKLFDRFYRVTKAHSKDNCGSGLGLAIAKSIVENHQGTIHVSSTVGVGTKFIISIPTNKKIKIFQDK